MGVWLAWIGGQEITFIRFVVFHFISKVTVDAVNLKVFMCVNQYRI